MRRQRVAVYGICRRGDEVLLTRAAPWLTVAGRWFLPGGGLDHGESPEEALTREIAEETGLEAAVGPLLGVLSDVVELPDGTSLHTVRLIHEVRVAPGELRFEADGSTDRAEWVGPDRLADLPLVGYVRRALASWPDPASPGGG